MMYAPFIVIFLVSTWLFLALYINLFRVLLGKGRFLRNRFWIPLEEKHVLDANGGNSASEDRVDGRKRGSRYDVFLSFRGPDTRFGLADVLYEFMSAAGIRVFRDYEELRFGEAIAGGIRRAIRDSSIYLVIFSPTYAESSWCLRELAMMAKDRIHSDGNEKIIMPVFRLVDHADVNLKTSLFREATDRHRRKYDDDIVQEWEDALKTVAHIRGWVSNGSQGLGKLASLVVQDVLRRLKTKERYVPLSLTGIDDQVDGVMRLLERDSSQVLFIILHGMGGIGKTILASVVFNRIYSWFQGCSFIPEVRKFSLKALTKKLLADVLNGPRTEIGDGFDGINEIRRRFRDMKVLMVFDDVSSADQLMMFAGCFDCLGAGSRILVTTRDVAVTRIGLPRDAVLTFDVKLLEDHSALQMFNRHAFSNDLSPPGIDLSKETFHAIGNLPLAVEAVAEQFHMSNDWRGICEKLKHVPPKKVMDALTRSYDELDDRQKQMFLDIACFQNMRKCRATTVYMWETLNLYPSEGITVLENKSLIKITNDDAIWMHEQLQAVGRELVLQEGPQIIRNRSRLWNSEAAWTVIQRKEVSETVVALVLGSVSKDRSLMQEDLERFPYLSYLELDGVHLEGLLEGFFSQLRWLSLRNYPKICLESNLKLENLIILQISGHKIRDGWHQLLAPNLRVLELSECLMKTTPDFSAWPKLERLIIRKNSLLEEIHHSLGKLQCLVYLEIQDCPSLRGIPQELHSLGALAALRLGSLIYSRDQFHSLEIYPPVSSEIPRHYLLGRFCIRSLICCNCQAHVRESPHIKEKKKTYRDDWRRLSAVTKEQNSRGKKKNFNCSFISRLFSVKFYKRNSRYVLVR